MKIFAAILILVACVSADVEWTPKNNEGIKQVIVECLKASSPSTEQIAKIKSFEFTNEPEIRQYILCSAEKFGVFCSQEGYHADRIAKQFKMDMDEEEVKKIAADCIAKFPKGDKANDVAAYEGHNCLINSVVGQKVQVLFKKLQEDI